MGEIKSSWRLFDRLDYTFGQRLIENLEQPVISFTGKARKYF